jgi:hypothetical protein
MKSKRTALLKKIFAGRDLNADAAALAMDVLILRGLTGDKTAETALPTLTAVTAAAMGKLTGADPREIMLAQMEDDLTNAGVVLKNDVLKDAPVKAAKPAKVKPAGSRSPFGGRSSFKLD